MQSGFKWGSQVWGINLSFSVVQYFWIKLIKNFHGYSFWFYLLLRLENILIEFVMKIIHWFSNDRENPELSAIFSKQISSWYETEEGSMGYKKKRVEKKGKENLSITQIKK